jgi:hypothetical protein
VLCFCFVLCNRLYVIVSVYICGHLCVYMRVSFREIFAAYVRISVILSVFVRVTLMYDCVHILCLCALL